MSNRHSAGPSVRPASPFGNRFNVLLVAGLALLAGAGGATGQTATAVAIGPDGGPLDALAASRDAKTLYASSFFAGFFRSTDGGAHWTRAGSNPEGSPSAVPLSLTVDSANAETVYARTLAGLFRSSDGGATWRNLNPLVPDVAACDPQAQRCGVPTALLADPLRPETVFAAFDGPGLLFRSQDSGTTWKPAVRGLANRIVVSLAAHAREAGHLFAGTDSGVYESRDGGASWTPSGSRPHWVYDVAADAAPGGALAYAIGLTPGTFHHPSCSTLQRRTKAGGPFAAIDGATGGHGCFPIDVETDPTTPGVAYLANEGGVLKTTNGGKSWGLVNDRPAKAVVAPAGSPGILLVQAQAVLQDGRAAVRRSSDGGRTWGPADHGLTANRVSGVLADPSVQGTLFAQVGSAELHKTTDGGSTWRRVESLPARWALDRVTVDPFTPGTLYASSLESVWKSPDRGVSWAPIFDGGVLAFTAETGTRGTLYAVSSDCALLLRSTDGGATWTQIGDTPYRFANLAVVPPATPGGAPTLFGTGYRTGLDPYAWDYRNELRRSTDGGLTWETLVSTAHFGTPFTALLLPPGRPQTVIAAFTETAMGDRIGLPLRGGVYRSQDNGRNWKVARLGADKPPVLALALDPRSPDRLFAASTRGRIYSSTDGGATWSPVAVSLPALDVDTLALDPNDPRTLFAGLDGGSAYRITLDR